jgi:hypothetical protein
MTLTRSQLLSALVALGLTVGGCGSKSESKKSKKDDDEESEDSDKKKKKKKKKKDDESDEEDDGASKKKKKKDDEGDKGSKDPAPTAAPTSPPSTGGPDLDAILGTSADGFKLRPFKGLKKDMPYAEAAKAISGLGPVSEFGFAKVTAGLPAGVKWYELTFLDAKLSFATIVFTKPVSDEAFWNKLVAHLKTQLAGVEMSNVGDHHVAWIKLMGDDAANIFVSQAIDMEEVGYEVKLQF